MDIIQARIDIMDWMTSFVEKPHPALAGWPPCPHARRARMDGLFDVRAGLADPYHDLRTIEMARFDVIALVYDPKSFTADEFEQQIRSANKAFLVPKDILALADHPAAPETVNGVTMNQGQWAIAFVQNLSKLNAVAHTLADRGYYHGWSEDYLQSLFEFRQDPRS